MAAGRPSTRTSHAHYQAPGSNAWYQAPPRLCLLEHHHQLNQHQQQLHLHHLLILCHLSLHAHPTTTTPGTLNPADVASSELLLDGEVQG